MCHPSDSLCVLQKSLQSTDLCHYSKTMQKITEVHGFQYIALKSKEPQVYMGGEERQ